MQSASRLHALLRPAAVFRAALRLRASCGSYMTLGIADLATGRNSCHLAFLGVVVDERREAEGAASVGDRAGARRVLEAEDALGVLVEDLLHHLVGVAELLPLFEEPLVRHARIVAAEHDLVLQPAAHIDL